MLLNKDKISELLNSEILFSLKITSYEKLTKNWLRHCNLTLIDFMTS